MTLRKSYLNYSQSSVTVRECQMNPLPVAFKCGVFALRNPVLCQIQWCVETDLWARVTLIVVAEVYICLELIKIDD